MPGGNPTELLSAAFVLLAVPFIVVAFPIASAGVCQGIGLVTQETAAIWSAPLNSLVPLLAAPNLE